MTSVDVWVLDQRSNTYDDHQTSKFVSQDAEQQYYDMYEERKQQNNRHLSYHEHQVNDNTCGMQRHDLPAVTSTTKSKVLKHLKIFPQLVKNSINGVIYDMKHYDEIPEPQNQSRVEYILTRDSRAPYLFSVVIGIVFIALLIACIANCCRDPPIVTGVPFNGYNQPPFPQSFVSSSPSQPSFYTVHPTYGKVPFNSVSTITR
jgi:lipopolysaccharide export LptBFGC system permease protein LptF